MGKKALIIVDCQNDYFPGGRCPLPGQTDAAKNIARLLEFSRSKEEDIIHLQHIYKDPKMPYLVEGTPGIEINEYAKPLDGEPVIVKHHMNAYRGTRLREHLEETGISEIVMCGSMSQNCVQSTARATMDLGYPLTIIYDACATETLEFNGRVVPADDVQTAIMASLAFAHSNVISTDEFLEAVHT